jgi:hypothetical protein
MSLQMKAILVMVPVCLIAIGYAITQANWNSAALLALIVMLMFVSYRAEKRIRSSEDPEHRNEV